MAAAQTFARCPEAMSNNGSEGEPEDDSPMDLHCFQTKDSFQQRLGQSLTPTETNGCVTWPAQGSHEWAEIMTFIVLSVRGTTQPQY
jgi:hypothetical protein